MTKSSFISPSVTRLILAWVVIALLTISIMKASASAAHNGHLPVMQPIPALSLK
jgi:hypothetical protein